MIKEEWKLQLEKQGFKYFVLKVEDFLNSLNENEIYDFNEMLRNYNECRESKPINSYFLINRDEYDFKSIDEFLEFLKERKNANNT